MKKRTILPIFAVIALVLGACGNTASDTKSDTSKSEINTKKTSEETVNMTKKVDGVAIEVKEVNKLDKVKKTDDTIIKIRFKGKNNSADPQALDSMLLNVKNSNGKSLKIYPSTVSERC
ncbi:hypothetical protein HCA64_14155 [Listeria booriae]|uniref:hypothetical protein n=1 Tax=Listeria booriae TaxID=1552123 RepID=UPI0016285B92|nr:hypothetical protein [Listeria booriae]MBC1907627.1 hypothetical protein [Listeria booriae]